MAKRNDVHPMLTVPFDDYSRMRIFANELWREMERLGPNNVFCYGYLERMAEELGIGKEDNDE